MSTRNYDFSMSLGMGILFGGGLVMGVVIVGLAGVGISSLFDAPTNPKPKCPDFAYATKVHDHWRCVQTIPPIGERAE